MSIQDDIHEHMTLAVEAQNEAASLRNKRDQLERNAQHADYIVRVHTSAAIRLKAPEPVLSPDHVRASLSDNYAVTAARKCAG